MEQKCHSHQALSSEAICEDLTPEQADQLQSQGGECKGKAPRNTLNGRRCRFT